MIVATSPVMKPRRSETRVPTTTCRNTSCPVCVVPNQCVADGGERMSGVKALGSFVRIIGPKIATSTKKTKMPRPKATLRFSVTRRHISRKRCTWEENSLVSDEGRFTSNEGMLIYSNSFPGARGDQGQRISDQPGSSPPAQQ